jgi:glycosyltransferase involved in cell wall biosynthesis
MVVQPMLPSVTVVVPSYNYAHFLEFALASVDAQTYASIETIVVDDGSVDDTAATARAWNVTVVRQLNRGLAAARNAGLRVARGHFVVVLDADDELMPDAIASGVAVLRAAPNVTMVARRSVLIDAAGQPLPTTYREVQNSDLYREWLGHNFAWTPGAVMFRREPLRAIGGFPCDAAAAADYAVYLQLSRSTDVLFDRREVVRYRQHDDNMSKDSILMLNDTLKVLEREGRFVPGRYRAAYRAGRRAWQQYYGERIVEELRAHVRAGRWRSRRVLRAIWFLLRCCPGTIPQHLRRKLFRTISGAAASPAASNPNHVADPEPSSTHGPQPIY